MEQGDKLKELSCGRNALKNSSSIGCTSCAVDVVSSLDAPFAMGDTLREYLLKAKKSVKIVCPYLGKDFIEILRSCVLSGLDLQLFTRIQENNNDHTFQAVEAFVHVAKAQGWNYEIRYSPQTFTHLKLIIIDTNFVISGSLNPTLSGIYYNDEILFVFKCPSVVEQVNRKFEKLWNRKENRMWQA